MAIKRSAGIAPVVILRNPCMQGRKHTSKELALKLGVYITRSSKQGITGPTKRTDVLQKKTNNKKPQMLNVEK